MNTPTPDFVNSTENITKFLHKQLQGSIIGYDMTETRQDSFIWLKGKPDQRLRIKFNMIGNDNRQNYPRYNLRGGMVGIEAGRDWLIQEDMHFCLLLMSGTKSTIAPKGGFFGESVFKDFIDTTKYIWCSAYKDLPLQFWKAGYKKDPMKLNVMMVDAMVYNTGVFTKWNDGALEIELIKLITNKFA